MLSRRKGERICIGDVEIIISEIARSHVRIAVRAPAGQQILRGEVKDSIEAQNRAAAASLPADAAAAEGVAAVEAPRTVDLRDFLNKRKT